MIAYARGVRRDALRMVAYYLTCVLPSGLTMALTGPLPTSLGPWEQPLEVTLGVGYAALALTATLARCRTSRRAEVRAIQGLALLSGGHGLVLLLAGQWAAGVRLAGTPLMMLSYAWLLHGRGAALWAGLSDDPGEAST